MAHADDKTVTVTKIELVAALEKWDHDAKASNWPDRPNDPSRFSDNADMLIDLLEGKANAR